MPFLRALWDEVCFFHGSSRTIGSILLRWSKDDDEIPLEHPEEDGEREVRKNKNKKKPCGKVSKDPCIDAEKPQTLYQPGEFKEIRLKYIARMKAKKGITFREASNMWNVSKKRETLLAGLSVQELKKRRVI